MIHNLSVSTTNSCHQFCELCNETTLLIRAVFVRKGIPMLEWPAFVAVGTAGIVIRVPRKSNELLCHRDGVPAWSQKEIR